jgi:hypothetical protein
MIINFRSDVPIAEASARRRAETRPKGQLRAGVSYANKRSRRRARFTSMTSRIGSTPS